MNAPMVTEVDALVLGGGLTGLAAGWVLQERAIVLEREARPGGLVRSLENQGWWFDHVLHLLYFRNKDEEARIRSVVGDILTPCPPESFVVTEAGTARFPIQSHLGHLDPTAAVACVHDLAQETFAGSDESPSNYNDLLRRSFGEALHRLFFEPYNAKMWRRPLPGLAPSGFVWNLHRPPFEDVLRGAIAPDRKWAPYNARGFYPRPPEGSTVRGMEVLSQALAEHVPGLRCRERIVSIDPEAREVETEGPEGSRRWRYRHACLSTVPLPRTAQLCTSVPAEVAKTAAGLPYNIVYSIAVRVRGPRPEVGHWRYYPNPELLFTRLVFLHAFDPLMAPREGWPLLVEVPWNPEEPAPPNFVERVLADVDRAGALYGGVVLDAQVVAAEPAYVVFLREGLAKVDRVRSWVESAGIDLAGRYGRWQYTSMAQSLGEGLAWGDRVAQT